MISSAFFTRSISSAPLARSFATHYGTEAVAPSLGTQRTATSRSSSPGRISSVFVAASVQLFGRHRSGSWLWLTFRAAAGATSFGEASIGLKYKMGDAGGATQR